MGATEHDEGPASVGTSMTAGTSQSFGKVKIEATAWCTLPCEVDDMKAVAAVAREIVSTDVKEAFREAHAAFMELQDEYQFPMVD